MDTTNASSDQSHERPDPTHPFPIEVVYNGKPKRIAVTLQQLISSVLAEAIKAFHVTQQPHMLSLFTEAGTELADNSTVQQNALEKGTVLYLRQSRVKGGIA